MSLICVLLQLFVYALVGRIVLSWFPLAAGGPMASVYSFLFSVTEPVLGPVRRVIPLVRMGSGALDLSPMLVIFGIFFLQQAICS
jgi:YggT family protein